MKAPSARLRASVTRLALPLIAALGPSVCAQAQQTFTPKGIVQWGQGGDRERAMLTQMGYGQLAQGQFGLSVADLNADGRPEILVLSMGACDNAGCPVTALQSGGQNDVRQLFSQRVGGRLAITNETVGGYNAFAAADPLGSIMKDAAGRQLVYPVGAGAQAGAAAPVAAPSAAPPRPVAAAPTTAPSPAAAPAAVARAQPAIAPERLAIVTGEGRPDWRTPGAEYLPVCTWPRCLNPQIAEKIGVGTEKATARGDVTTDDATRWCRIHMPNYSACVEVEMANNGTRGGLFGRRFVARAEANCVAGTLRAVDGATYTYAGTWPDGGPGAGRARFSGTGNGTRFFEQQGLGAVNSGQTSLAELSRENNSGEALAIQWEILCKGAAPPVR
jgi:hypothetical protein